MSRRDKHCTVCGEHYLYCRGCAEYAKEPAWKNIFHNKNCREISHITTGYKLGNITREEAIDRYSKTDLSYKDKIRESIRCIIDELLLPIEIDNIEPEQPEEVVLEQTEEIVEEIIEEKEPEKEIEEISEESPIEPPVKTPKRKRKVSNDNNE